MELKKGGWALINNVTNYNNGYQSIVQKNNCPVMIYQISDSSVYCKTINMFFNNFAENPFIIYKTYLTAIDEKEAKKLIDALNIEGEKINKENLKKIETKRLPIGKRKDYDLRSKEILKTDLNFVKIYPISSVDNSVEGLKSIQNNWMVQCCAFSKTKADLLVHIPKLWLNYFGYNLVDLKAYINFLKKCDIGFNAKVLGIVDLHSTYKQVPNKRNISLNLNTDNFVLKEKETAYEVLVKGSANCNMITYLYFILIRYIYSSLYWNIPIIAMKLKKNMPKVSHWDCLILAHNTHSYNSGYSLCVLGNGTIYPKYNQKEIILKKLRSGEYGMNSSFTVTSNNSKIKEYIIQENYEELQKLIK